MRGMISMFGGAMMLALAATAMAQPAAPAAPAKGASMSKPIPHLTNVYDFPVKPMETDKHSSTTLAQYKGKVLMILNVASKCGNTPQYAKLEKMSNDFKDKGLVIIGFPCNQFGGQEPGTEAEILEFCKATYQVDFPMYAKIDVNGPNASPLYKFLTDKNGPTPGDITWNFEKFIVGRDGNVISRFPPKTQPDDPSVMTAINIGLNQTAR